MSSSFERKLDEELGLSAFRKREIEKIGKHVEENGRKLNEIKKKRRGGNQKMR